MIDEATAPPAAGTPSGRDRWRTRGLAALAVAVFIAGGFAVSRRMEPVAAPTAIPSSQSSTALSTAPSPVAPSTSPPAPSTKPSRSTGTTVSAGVLQLPGAVPARGSGRFAYASGRGAVAGGQGQLRRFRVAVEIGSNEDVKAFAEQVAGTLGDPRSWTGGGRLRLQRVGGADPAEFTVYLATRDTAGKMCLRGGTNIRVGGRPYTSCRTTGKAIINLDRWRLSAPPYVRAKVALSTYRQYVINHEVGHELGHHHQGCPRAGGPAPVMVQQTLTLRGCKAYAWPRLNGKAFTGPSL
ncbi:DUF3152 domain-containing protein [Actinoplanes sp. M2I2]|uniref:DUF3152 domain-containing protein n=1 Tax=Actinoplanes sp. M2I2 TaxID=1734444 RepID=UPI0020218C9B|nr:DUF3152 domain-containing protein [Actinoplanes sp. M2I2]